MKTLILRTAVVFALVASPAVADPATNDSPASALEYAFRFASALEADPKDRAKAQQILVAEVAAAGDLETAVRWAERIEGWRRAASIASLAGEMARHGRDARARELLGAAQRALAEEPGWEGRRIEAHIAHALALLGDLEAARGLSIRLAATDSRQYGGRAAAIVATGLAVRGEFSAALDELSKLEAETDLDVAWWRTAGYMNLAEHRGATDSQRLEAAAAARESAERVPTWRRLEALVRISEIYEGLGYASEARAALVNADEVLSGFGFDVPVKAPLTASVARAWGSLGSRDRARALLTPAAHTVENQLVIDRPGVYAAIAVAYAAAGDAEMADRKFDHAWSAAESLVNARPRALAVVAVCRSMAEVGRKPDPDTRKRLDVLYSGLRAPW